MSETDFDLVIVGGGIVGLATGFALSDRHPELSIAIIEKEEAVARHQTGHNSGVVHSGIYYAPGSLRARLCIQGVRLLADFCRTHDLPYVQCGKVIVATSEDEVPRLEALHARGVSNGVPGLKLIERGLLAELEPAAAGIRAIHSPETAITDYTAIAAKLQQLLQERGVRFFFQARVTAIGESAGGVEVITEGGGRVRAAFLVNCAGLYADEVARAAGHSPQVRIVPFRGEYYRLKPGSGPRVNGTIYPVPDPAFPFLGVHLTSTVTGELEIGPNAVLAFAREGYSWKSINVRELLGSLSYRGVWQLGRKHWRYGAHEYYRSLRKTAFLRSAQRLVPSLTGSDIEPFGAGVRAQAVNPDGSLVDDFAFVSTGRSLHVLNAPSPAATASLAIGRYITREYEAAVA